MEVVFEDGDVGLGVRSSDIIMEEMNYRVEVGDGAASHDLNCEVGWPSNGEIAGGLGYERGGGGDKGCAEYDDWADKREGGSCTHGLF